MRSATLGDVNRIPIFRELFRCLDNSADEYGLVDRGRSVRSKAFFVSYSIAAPEGFTEDLEHDSRYRGVFCFIVDDTLTDDKRPPDSIPSGAGGNELAETRLSDAEITDREDIRTFIHNSVTILRLILEQQALENERLQPGAEQFVVGMLHRLKNELSTPKAALDSVRNFLGRMTKKSVDVDKLSSGIALADATFAGIQELFDGLKGLTVIRAGTVPLRNFSSNWLGWMYASTICDTVKKLLGDAALDVDQRKSLLERVEEARDSAVGAISREQMSYEGADGGSHAGYSRE